MQCTTDNKIHKHSLDRTNKPTASGCIKWLSRAAFISAALLANHAMAADCSDVTQWDAGTVYTAETVAVRDGTLFKAKWWTRGDDPVKRSGTWDVWASQGACAVVSSSSVSSSSVSSASSSSVSSSVSSSSLGSSSSSNSSSNASSCGAAEYVAGTAYSANQLVQNAGNEYRCTIAGWCSSNAAWAYAPGTGAHWQDAWQWVASCQASSSSSSVSSSSLSSSSSSSAVSSSSSSTSSAATGDRIISGYWHNFDNGSGVIPIAEVSSAFDAINVSFAEPTGNAPGEIGFVLDPAFDEQAFRDGIAAKQAAGKKVIISIGGALGQVQLETAQARANFVSSMITIIDEYGFDGLDVDFEGHSLYLNQGDDDFRNPTTPVITNLIDALKALTSHYGNEFMLTMAPETFFVQLGYSFYGGTCSGCDRRAGAYLPVIYAMRDELNWLQVQNYNSGPITGLDDQYHTMGVADFHVAMVDMLLTGFTIAGTNDFFPPLREDQVLLGLPANGNAGGGFTSVSEVHSALNCLIKLQGCGSYQPHTNTGWRDLRGLMTWSINWDKFNNFEFSTQHRQYLDAL
jgi:chitinase